MWGPVMSISPTSSNSGSIPFHIARAYGLQPAQRSAPTQQAQQVQQTGAVAAAGAAPGKLPSAAQKLVAAVVPGKVDFSGDTPVQVSGGGGGTSALSMYRHPADRNAAATAVSIGKSLDVSG